MSLLAPAMIERDELVGDADRALNVALVAITIGAATPCSVIVEFGVNDTRGPPQESAVPGVPFIRPAPSDREILRALASSTGVVAIGPMI